MTPEWPLHYLELCRRIDGAVLSGDEAPAAWAGEVEAIYGVADDLAMELTAPDLRSLRISVLCVAAEVRAASALPLGEARRLLRQAATRLHGAS